MSSDERPVQGGDVMPAIPRQPVPDPAKADERLAEALSHLMHDASRSKAEFDTALRAAYTSYIESRGGEALVQHDAVTDGERYGWVLGFAGYFTESPAYQVQFLGEPAPVTAGDELRKAEPPVIELRSWTPSLPMSYHLLGAYQVDHELLTDYGLRSPYLSQDRDRQTLLRELSTWGQLDEDRLLAGLRPYMNQIRAGREAELQRASRQIQRLVAAEFPANKPATDAAAPEATPERHADSRTPRPRRRP